MNINRNNYETFFLLYVDGEISPQEMLEVDAFCQKHPDLADELQLLMDTRLNPEAEIACANKAALLKLEEWDADHLTNEQLTLLENLGQESNTHSTEFADALTQKEWTLLQQTQLPAEAVNMPHKHTLIKAMLWDAENLTHQQLQMLEALESGTQVPASILADPEMHKDWLLLQQTQMQPEQLVMPNKQRLYRQEAPAGSPVVRLAWWRYAAAAAVVAGIGWFALGYINNAGNEEAQRVSQQNSGTPKITAPVTEKADTLKVQEQPLPVQEQTPVQLVSNDSKSIAPAKAQTEKQLATATVQEESAASSIAAYRLSRSEEQALRGRASQDGRNIDQNGRAPINARDYVNSADAVVATNNNNGSVKFENAVMMEEAEEDEYINIGGARIKSQKLRGVLRTVSRKVTRSFDKSTVAPAETAAAELK
jgi:hypothetical protein